MLGQLFCCQAGRWTSKGSLNGLGRSLHFGWGPGLLLCCLISHHKKDKKEACQTLWSMFYKGHAGTSRL